MALGTCNMKTENEFPVKYQALLGVAVFSLFQGICIKTGEYFFDLSFLYFTAILQ